MKQLTPLLLIFVAISSFVLSCSDVQELGEPAPETCVETTNVVTFLIEGKKYELVKEYKTWKDASVCAVRRGGYLTEINDKTEQDELYKLVGINVSEIENLKAFDGGGGAYVWIGASAFILEGVWTWDGNGDNKGPQFWQGDEDGDPVNSLYNNWGFEPDNSTDHNAVGMALTHWNRGSAGQWNDIQQENRLFFIIEYD